MDSLRLRRRQIVQLTSAGGGSDRSLAYPRRRPEACSRPTHPTRSQLNDAQKRRRRTHSMGHWTDVGPKTRPTSGYQGALQRRPKGPPSRTASTRARAKAAESRAEARGEEPKLVPPLTPRSGHDMSTPGQGDILQGHARAPRRCIHRSECAPQAQDPRPVRVRLPCAPPVAPASAIMQRQGRVHEATPTRGPEGGRRGPEALLVFLTTAKG